MRQHRQGLTIPQFQVLVRVHAQPNISLSCIAEYLGSSLPMASRLVTTLVNRGYLSRMESGSDRRQIAIQLTSRGLAITQAARQASLKQMEGEFAALDPSERALVGRAMSVLSGFVNRVKQPTAAPLLSSGSIGSNSEATTASGDLRCTGMALCLRQNPLDPSLKANPLANDALIGLT